MLRSWPISPQIGDTSANESVAGHAEEGMGRVAVGKRPWGRRDERNERWEEEDRTNGTNRASERAPHQPVSGWVDFISEKAINVKLYSPVN